MRVEKTKTNDPTQQVTEPENDPEPQPIPQAQQPQQPTALTEDTRQKPSLEVRNDARARFNAETGAQFREHQIQASVPVDPDGNTHREIAPKDGVLGQGQREQAVKNALERPGERQQWWNSDGESQEISITKDGDDKYKINLTGTDNGQPYSNDLTVKLDQGIDPNKALPNTIDYYSETPTAVRGDIQEIEFKNGQGPLIDGTEDPNDRAAADERGGKITFYDGTANLNGHVFHHEFGHGIGEQFEDREDGGLENFGEGIFGERGKSVPKEYEEAAKKDGNFTSDYAKASENSYVEDFADAWSSYMEAIDQGTPAVDAWKAKYPNRAEWFANNLPTPTSGVREYDVIENLPPGTV
jgi:hypothetical protein